MCSASKSSIYLGSLPSLSRLSMTLVIQTFFQNLDSLPQNLSSCTQMRKPFPVTVYFHSHWAMIARAGHIEALKLSFDNGESSRLTT